ncbi:slit homolog 2 protein-like [Patiria miniata]|uniref:LRRCT domain-containing protein n=1 Tax=Patiria miniata TaxID=46514 RepID=A0A913ZMU5_PATMI|nr:slit homolog 2 protein-like [Patiria miniata]
MVRRHFIWIAVFLVCSLPAKGTPECTSQCQNRSKVVECVGRNLTRVPSSNKCQRVFSLILDNNWIDLKTGDFASFCGLDAVLSLNRNRIKIISPYAFRNLSKLEKLYLNENKLTNLSRYAFEGLTSLKRLSLSENKLAVIERGIFENLIGAEIFLLNDNVIQNIEVGSFTALRNLKQLELRSNRIEILLNHTFSGLSGLQELDLSNNIVRFMEFNAFRDLTSLNRLNLSRNRIVSVSAVYDLRLTVLDLSFNKVTNLNKDLNRRLTSQHQFAINVSNNSLICDCDIEPLYDWYRNQSSPEGGIAQCAAPPFLHGTPLTEISMQDVCSTNMDATSQTLWTTAAANSNDAMARPGLDEKTESSWTLPVMCVVLGLLGLLQVLLHQDYIVFPVCRTIPRATITPTRELGLWITFMDVNCDQLPPFSPALCPVHVHTSAYMERIA